MFVGKLLVNSSEDFQFCFNFFRVSWVQEDLEKARSIDAISDSLANNLSGVDEIIKNGVVNSSQSATARSLLS